MCKNAKRFPISGFQDCIFLLLFFFFVLRIYIFPHNKSFKPAKRSCYIEDLWSCAVSQSKMCIVDDDSPPFARECHRLLASQQKFQKTDVTKCRFQRRRKEKLRPKVGDSTAVGLRNMWTSKLLRESSPVCSAVFAKDYNLPRHFNTAPVHLSPVSGSFLIGVLKSISSNCERDFAVIWMH